jgi:hypothetical protein
MWLQQAIFVALLIFFSLLWRVPRIKSWIDGVFSNPTLLRKIAGWLVVLSVVEWAEAKLLGWVNSVQYVSHLSQLAITLSTIPWWQGLRVEEHQVEEDIPNEVVAKIVEKTNVEPQES